MAALLAGIVAASFLGSLHCVGMCGPLVCAYAATSEGERAGPAWLRHLAYQGGRLLTLLLVGLLAGALGSGVDLLGAHAGLQRTVAVVAGGLMVLWGAVGLLGGCGWKVPLPSALQARLTRAVGAARRRPPVVRALLIGLLTPLLPCGWLWLFVLAAAGTGHALAGAAVLAAFWAGNLPALLGVGVTVQTALRRLRPRLSLVTGILLIVMGSLLIAQRSYALSRPLPATPVAAPPTVEAQQDLPCCHDR